MRFSRIRGLREDMDWTQQVVADKLFIHRRTYSAYENGVNAITPELLIQIAALYGVSVDYLLGLTDETAPYPKSKHRTAL